jgi:ABC-type transporter Mla maintaining outer membrane lipid asymmetry ATPase subunit MlaF
MSTLVQVRDLEVRRGGRTALLVDELDVLKGEVLAVVGPNGAGRAPCRWRWRLVRPGAAGFYLMVSRLR